MIRNSVLLDRIMITDKTFTLDMNGYTIILGANATEINAIIELSGNSDVTVAGNGEITFNDSYMEYNDLGYIFRLEDNAKLTIENGNYHAGLTCVQVGNNATAIIKDGSFSTYATWEGKSWLLNKLMALLLLSLFMAVPSRITTPPTAIRKIRPITSALPGLCQRKRRGHLYRYALEKVAWRRSETHTT